MVQVRLFKKKLYLCGYLRVIGNLRENVVETM